VVERRLEIPEVAGSSPARGTTFNVTPTQRERFLGKLVRKESGCLEWPGQVNRGGYGKVKIGSTKDGSRRDEQAHRVAFHIEHGYCAPVVRHSCDNPPCCDHTHLLAGTHADNTKDKVDRGRAKTGDQRGQQNGYSKLKDDEVLRIKRQLLDRYNNKEIAAMFGVTHQTISLIRRDKKWQHLK
jgi:hypothetical protein